MRQQLIMRLTIETLALKTIVCEYIPVYAEQKWYASLAFDSHLSLFLSNIITISMHIIALYESRIALYN